jgi:hypothetical protein
MTAARGIQRKREGEAVWQGRMAQYEASGLTARTFCEREGLSKGTFRRWRARLRAGARGEGVRTKAGRDHLGQGVAGFVDLGDIAGREAEPGRERLEFTLDLGGGLRVHVVRG